MSLLEGILKVSFGVSYKVEEGIRDIKKGIRSSKKVILNNIPVSLLQELMPLLKGKNVSVSLKKNEFEDLVEDDIKNISYHKAGIHAGHGDEKMHFGCVVLPKMLFDVIWNDEGVQSISGIKLHSCLKCDLRVNLCQVADAFGEDVYIGGVYNAEEGVRLIKEDFKKSSKALINYLPDFLVEELIPFFKGKDIRIMMPYGHRIHSDIKSIPHSRVSSRLIKPKLRIYEHHDAMPGGICFPHIHYGVAWKDGKILEIRTIEVKECVECMVGKHMNAWSFGRRIRS